MNTIGTTTTITRGTAVPLIMEISELGDLTDGWTITFTMRTSVTSSGNPLIQYDNEDVINMTVSAGAVTVNLYETDTWAIPEGCEQVYIQLNFRKLAKVVATDVYALGVAPNLLKQEESPR